MALEHEAKLEQIKKQIKEGIKPQAVTARTFIGWFGAQRRSSWNVEYIRSRLRDYQLVTEPDFEYVYIDSEISFTLAPKKKSPQAQEETIRDVYTDPTYRVGKLASANLAAAKKQLVSVKPDDLVRKAVTLMITHDYSQLPVMTSEREVKGILSWVSLGTQIALGKKCEYVRDCIVPHNEISSDTYIFNAVDNIVAHQYALIRNEHNVVTGIVTTSDLSLEFRRLGEAFLLLGEIEKYVRRMVHSKYTIDDIRSACHSLDKDREIQSLSDLTIGEYQRLIENPKNWDKLSIPVDREVFVKKMDEIRQIRNDVMHFDPDGISEQDMNKLRDFVRLMQSLAKVGII